ncbi:hypothetical protein CAPTEDRAFT_215737 [Capitella teleta]|uniref:Uncharacterized protein n=1 Tax=Capitella teleta TaxID=283909 RepID=R7VAE1_CAPTE|nr:hypothetical protein CAPTEDRAFT_215737 [Capitella teleta]|eukprot:ELU15793.1 hypothetical protein CAPTEDRAFT_215737 [Capitella teleta]
MQFDHHDVVKGFQENVTRTSSNRLIKRAIYESDSHLPHALKVHLVEVIAVRRRDSFCVISLHLRKQNSLKRDECEISFMRSAERSAQSTAPIVNYRKITLVTSSESEIERKKKARF